MMNAKAEKKPLNKLVLKRIGPNKWELVEDWKTQWVLVPKGFVTDGASVPRIFWWFASPSGDLFEASVIHDYLYKNAIGDKPTADITFLNAAEFYGALQIKAKLAYVVVRAFGEGKYEHSH